MRQSGLDDRGFRGVPVEPVQELSHLGVQPGGRWRLEMHLLSAVRARDHLHGATRVVTPRAHAQPRDTGVPRGEQARMPPEKPVRGHLTIVVDRRVEHHFDDAIDMSISRGGGADIDTQVARDGRADGLGVEHLALDLARLDHVRGQSCQAHLVGDSVLRVGEASEQQPLTARGIGNRPGQAAGIIGERRPAGVLPDVPLPSGHAVIITLFSA